MGGAENVNTRILVVDVTEIRYDVMKSQIVILALDVNPQVTLVGAS